MSATMAMTGYIGKCRAKGCRHATRSSEWVAAKCPDHGRYSVDPIWGYEDENIKCGAKCRGATGPSCDCSCGGHNHGINHA